MLRLIALLTVALVGCGPRVSADEPSPFEEDDPHAREPRLIDETAITESTRQTVVRKQRGTISRTVLVSVLDDGLGKFIRGGVEVRPSFADERFAGWEIVRFYPDDSRFAEVDLRPGDVVVDVNERAIERPAQAQVVWDSLRKAGELVVRGHRNGKPFELRYRIQGPPATQDSPEP
jgi:hypothetical protein